MGTINVILFIITVLIFSSCGSDKEINNNLAVEVLNAQIQQEARFDRSDQNEAPKIKLLTVEVMESEILPKLVETDRDKFRVRYQAKIEILEDCTWGTDRNNPRGFTRFITRSMDDQESWMHITNATESKQGDQEELTHFFDLTKTDEGWVDAYSNNY